MVGSSYGGTAILYNTDTTASTWGTASTLNIQWSTGTVSTVSDSGSGYCITGGERVVEVIPADLPAGNRTLGLPDGSKLIMDDMGNYRIEDAQAKVKYQANRVREFSPHLNASDLLADFVRYVGTLGVKQSEVLGLPIELFINWLIIEAAERDRDPVPADVVPVAKHTKLLEVRKPKCLQCGRFIPLLHNRNRFPFCNPGHAAKHLDGFAPQTVLQLSP